MTIIEYLDNVKRVGTLFKIVNGWGTTLYSGTVSTYKNWVHRIDYDDVDIFMMAFNKDNILEIQIDTDDF